MDSAVTLVDEVEEIFFLDTISRGQGLAIRKKSVKVRKVNTSRSVIDTISASSARAAAENKKQNNEKSPIKNGHNIAPSIVVLACTYCALFLFLRWRSRKKY